MAIYAEGKSSKTTSGNVERILGRRVADQAQERLKQIAALAQLRSQLRDILESSPKIHDKDFVAAQNYMALKNCEKIIGLVLLSMNKATREPSQGEKQ